MTRVEELPSLQQRVEARDAHFSSTDDDIADCRARPSSFSQPADDGLPYIYAFAQQRYYYFAFCLCDATPCFRQWAALFRHLLNMPKAILMTRCLAFEPSRPVAASEAVFCQKHNAAKTFTPFTLRWLPSRLISQTKPPPPPCRLRYDATPPPTRSRRMLRFIYVAP